MKYYNAHVAPTYPISEGGEEVYLYIGDTRYLVRRVTRETCGAPLSAEAAGTWYGCYRKEYRKYSWRDVRVNDDFRTALLKAAIPEFEKFDAAKKASPPTENDFLAALGPCGK